MKREAISSNGFVEVSAKESDHFDTSEESVRKM